MKGSYIRTPEFRKRMGLLKLGSLNPMYGSHLSSDHRKRISLALKGKRKPSSAVRFGEAHHNWKEKIRKNCLTCNKEMLLPPCYSTRKYCSLKCTSTAKFGMFVSEETRQKLRLSSTGRHYVSNRKGKTYKDIYGDTWQNEIAKRRATRIAYHDRIGRYPSTRGKHGGWEYRAWRTSVYERDDWTCQRCGIKGGILNAHHANSWARYPEWRFSVDNGLTLCISCHTIANQHQRRWEFLKVVSKLKP